MELYLSLLAKSLTYNAMTSTRGRGPRFVTELVTPGLFEAIHFEAVISFTILHPTLRLGTNLYVKVKIFYTRYDVTIFS